MHASEAWGQLHNFNMNMQWSYCISVKTQVLLTVVKGESSPHLFCSFCGNVIHQVKDAEYTYIPWVFLRLLSGFFTVLLTWLPTYSMLLLPNRIFLCWWWRCCPAGEAILFGNCRVWWYSPLPVLLFRLCMWKMTSKNKQTHRVSSRCAQVSKIAGFSPCCFWTPCWGLTRTRLFSLAEWPTSGGAKAPPSLLFWYLKSNPWYALFFSW